MWEGAGGQFTAIDASSHKALAIVVTSMGEEDKENVSSEILQANAQLIAAAPELLAALKEVLTTLEREQAAAIELIGGSYSWSCAIEARVKAKLLILKLEGE